MFNYNNRNNPIVLFCSGKGSRQSSKKSFFGIFQIFELFKIRKE